MKYKALLWDNDGTLADTKDWILSSFDHCMKEILNDSNPNRDKFLATMGQPLEVQLALYTPNDDIKNKLVLSYRAYNKSKMNELLKSFDGLNEVLQKLTDAGYFNGIVTSKTRELTIKGLRALGIDKYFSYVQGCYECTGHKPDPIVMTFALNKLGLKPSDVLYIGDTIFDMQAGSGAGCDTCAVLWGVNSKEQLVQTNPTYIVQKPKDLLNILL